MTKSDFHGSQYIVSANSRPRPRRRGRPAGDGPLKLFLIYVALILMTLFAVYPVLNVITISLRPQDKLYSTSLRIIPENATLANYRIVLFERDFFTWLKNSAIVSTAVAVLGVIFAASAAYAFSRFDFWGRNAGLTFLLVTQMFPAPMLLLPTYLLLKSLGLANTLQGLVVPYMATALPFCIWILKGFFDTIPKELDEAARIDGASMLGAFWRVVLPLSRPALAITALFSFMTAWSEYIVARVVLSHKDLYTLPIGLVSLQRQFTTEWGTYSAASILVTVPVLVLFAALSKHLVSGLTLGSVKG